MRETKFYAKLKPMFDKWGEVDRVENSLGSGMPDIFYNFNGIGGWIETKVAKGRHIYFEKFQPNWMRKHLRQGFKRIFVIVLDQEETIYVFHGSTVAGAVFVPYKKWIVTDLYMMSPALVMTKPYNKQDELMRLLTS